MALARQLVAALALTYGATALLDGFVDVVVKVDVHLSSDAFAGVVGAAVGANGDGYDACSTANDMINICDSDSNPDPDQCLCCSGTAAVASVYSSCASYIANDVPNASTAYQLVSQIYRICSKAGTDVCTATASGPSPTEGSSGAITGVSAPAACTSMLQIYSSCYFELSSKTARPEDAASCFCYDQSGNYDTIFDDYARTCALFAKTADPDDYRVMVRLATICDEFAAITSSEALVFTTVRTGSNSGGFGLPSSTSSSSSTSSASPSSTPSATQSTGQAGSSTGVASTPSSSALAASGLAMPGFTVWIANLTAFILSFFVLV